MHTKLLSLFFVCTSFFSCLFGMDTHTIHTAKTTILYDGIEIQTPCVYREVSAAELNNTTIVTERSHTTITKPGKEFAALLPLHPCTGAGVKNLLTGVSCWLHWHYSNSARSAIQTIRNTLGGAEIDPQHLTAFIFSKKMKDEIYNKGWRSCHEGRSQEEQMAFIQQILIQGLKIDAKQVQSYLFTTGACPDPYHDLDRSIFVDGTDNNGVLNLYSILPTRELGLKKHTLDNLCSDFTIKAYGQGQEGDIWRYNAISFAEAPKYNGGRLSVYNTF
jgi:hypothetical protein